MDNNRKGGFVMIKDNGLDSRDPDYDDYGYFIASIYVEGWFNGLNGAEWSSGHHEKRYSDTLSGLNQLIGEIYE